MFKNLERGLRLPDLEKEILDTWKSEKTFERVLEEGSGKDTFVFYEGPPTANGEPGIHHVMARSVKDAVCRYKTMQGFHTPRKAGWDTHGLPVEIEVQKKLGIEGRSEIEEYGMEKFNQACRESVFKYKGRWDQLTQQMGYWIDLNDPYITLENNYIETLWWILKQFHEKGLVYKGHRVVPYCPKCETPLSSHEVAQGYKDVSDLSAYVAMQSVDEDLDYLVWTTTPWTLFSNVAIAVGAGIDYVSIKIESRERPLVLAKSRLSTITEEYKIIDEFKGEKLVGKKYKALFDHVELDRPAHVILAADFVSTEDGSGLVHIAPAFGEDDFKLGQKENLPVPNPVDERGCFKPEVTELKGRFVKDCDLDIVMMLKEKGLLYRSQKVEHSYPHCWRCQNPLIYYARDAWYIRMTSIKNDLIAANQKVGWFPETFKSGRFGNWLENLQDWSISRDRYWGTPLNIWVCEKENCDAIKSVGSVEEIKGFDGYEEGMDLHRPYVDRLSTKCSCGGTMRRTPEVVDCWFDSGAMPFAQFHYPFENKELFEKNFPADFISEGVDQTRGWFYTMLAISTFLKGESSYKNVVVNELILDKDGTKMSKTRGNTVNPFDIMDQHGADVLRWYLLTSTSIWQTTKFDIKGLEVVKRKFFDTLLNTYRFFVMYANVDAFDESSPRPEISERNEFDRWLISRMNSVVAEVIEKMDQYDISRAMNILSDFFIEDVSNWYVRLNRRRYWKSGDSKDKNSAYCTLQEVLIVCSRLMAPVAPFLSDKIHRNLSGGSVHLSSMPSPDSSLCDKKLEESMALTRRVVELGRNLRTQHSLKNRQPLSEIIAQSRGEVFEEIILSELNVKKYTRAGEGEDLIKKKAKANFRKLGPVFGKKVPLVAALIQKIGEEEIKKMESGEDLYVELDSEKLKVPSECVEVVYDQLEGLVAENDGQLIVALRTEITEELRQEALSREFVNRVQNLRKDVGLEITDRISLYVKADKNLIQALSKYVDTIDYECLSKCQFDGFDERADFKEFEIEEFSVSIAIEKVS